MGIQIWVQFRKCTPKLKTVDYNQNLQLLQAVTREIEMNKTPKKQKKGLTPKKWLKGSTPSRNFQSPAGPSAVRSTNFVLMACLPITIKSVTKAHFSLDKVGQ